MPRSARGVSPRGGTGAPRSKSNPPADPPPPEDTPPPECTEDDPCPDGAFCVEEECVISCGFPDAEGTCTADGHCASCGLEGESWGCEGAEDETPGTCVKLPDGCQDVGDMFTLPAPWDEYTAACDEASDCDGLAAPLDVGQMIIDLYGSDTIAVGPVEVVIQPTPVDYPMETCAEYEAMGMTCGACVPCTAEIPCGPLDIASVIPALFGEDPLGAAAAALLVELLWPGQDEKNLHFWCQEVSLGIGVCVPCLNPLTPCVEPDPQPQD